MQPHSVLSIYGGGVLPYTCVQSKGFGSSVPEPSIPGTRFGNDKRACVTAPILKGAPNCAGYADFFAVDNGGLLTKGDYHPSTTSALVGENIQQDIEYSRMGRAYSTTQMGSAPAVVGYWNPTPLEELTPPPFPQSLVHDPSDIWTIFYRSPSDNTLWYLGTMGYGGPVPDSTPESIDPVVWDEGSEPTEPTEPLVTVLLPKVVLDNDTDLPGSDYRNLELSTANPNLCALECSVDSACRAFTYVKPGYQGPNAQCWLKNAVP
ncbi:MAG: PAN domain-containing protein, partial [Methanotrichaceae archaeon]|nr:PAN domain-containing protein [Methanotrichaceae archaeon]